MTLRHIISVITLALAGCGLAFSAAIDDARSMYHKGEYEAVVNLLTPVVKKTPKDGNATFFLGASLYELGRKAEATPYLTVAESRNVAEASHLLALISLENYSPSEAQEHLNTWESALTKQKKSIPEEYNLLISRAIQMRNMLERVEQIEVIDSLLVDKATFLSAYRLSPAAGRILPPDAVGSLGAGMGHGELSVAYLPENRSELLWAEADDNGVFSLYSADILDDGTIDNSTRLDDSLGEGGDAKYPFLMPDGVTLYFANNGSNSLGGYDIFMTRRTDGSAGKEYYQPQNVGMPYNSPYDDYMLAIDETSGLGWWATDRNQLPDKVTIYIFTHSQLRVNVSPYNSNLRAIAKLSDISLTQKEGTDYAALLASKLPEADNSTNDISNRSPKFALDMGNGKIYTSLSDFRNDRARMAMLEVLTAEATLRKHLEKEDALRARYSKGDKSVSKLILDSEAQTESMRKQIASQRNSAIRLETK